MTSPTERTLAWARSRGWSVAIVERRIPRMNVSIDLFGVFDLIAVDPGGLGVVGIQVKGQVGTAGGVTKLRESEILPLWLGALNRALVIGWSKKKIKRGGVAFRYTPRVVELFTDREEVHADPSS
jgi:hypothetical protein